MPQLAAPATPARNSSPPRLEDPQDLLAYLDWFKLREPSSAEAIEGCLAVFLQQKDTLSTLEGISEDRVARHELPAGLITRMKRGVKHWQAGS